MSRGDRPSARRAASCARRVAARRRSCSSEQRRRVSGRPPAGRPSSAWKAVGDRATRRRWPSARRPGTVVRDRRRTAARAPTPSWPAGAALRPCRRARGQAACAVAGDRGPALRATAAHGRDLGSRRGHTCVISGRGTKRRARELLATVTARNRSTAPKARSRSGATAVVRPAAASARARGVARHQLALHAARLGAVGRAARPGAVRGERPTRWCRRRSSARACRAGRRAAPASATGASSSTRVSRLRGIRSAEPM